MMQFRLSTPMWKGLLCCVALLSTMLAVIELRHAIEPVLIKHEHGSLGAALVDRIGATSDGQGTYRLRIDSVKSGSPLEKAGAAAGDHIRFDHYADRFRAFSSGERVDLTLYQGTSARRLSVVAAAVSINTAEYVDYYGRFLLAFPAIIFGLMIGFKQADQRSYRALAMAFMLLSLMYFYNFNYSPRGPVFALSKFLNITTSALMWYFCLVFALSYHPYPASPLRAWLTRLFPWYRVLAFATAIYAAGYALGMETPMLWLGSLLSLVGGLVMTIASLVDGWRHSSGELRQRHLWLLLSFACGTVPSLLILIPTLDPPNGDDLRVTVLMFFVGQLLMFVGLAYAATKYRVFNFDFAVSRALVFSVVNVSLLCAFWLVEQISAPTLHGSSVGHGEQKGVAEAGVALLAFLVLHKVHGRLERGVELVLFKKWHVNERKLRSFVRQAAHITTAASLLDAFRGALDRFTGQAGCAIYLLQDSGEYALATATLQGAAAIVDFNDSAAVALRTDMKLVFVGQMQTVLHGELALPMCHRGMLDGFVLVGSKRGGYSYRPDEFEALAFAAHQVGLDLHALRVDTLERELRELELKAGQQQQELVLMAGRRRSMRGAAEPVGAELGSISA